jgi:hypothetical protein
LLRFHQLEQNYAANLQLRQQLHDLLAHQEQVAAQHSSVHNRNPVLFTSTHD